MHIYLKLFQKFLGPVKNISPPSHGPATVVRNMPWASRATTYPPSYMLTDVISAPLASSNVHKSSVICPTSQSWRVPDPYDCSIYHDCYHGTDLVSHCPAQLQYNPEKQACDYTQNVQCIKFHCFQFVSCIDFLIIYFNR